MKAIAIVGSPRVGGNSEILARHCLEAMASQGVETELIHLVDYEIHGCTDCGVCRSEETCSIDDDLWPVYEKMKEAQGIALSAATYFGSATPELKALMDRSGYIAHKHGNLFARKVGSPIAVSRRAGHNFTYAQLLLWFNVNGFLVPGSSYWAVALGRELGEVRNDEEGMRTVHDLGLTMAWLMEVVQETAVD